MFILAICASQERYFTNNGWTRSKVEKENKACISPKTTYSPDSLTQKFKHLVRDNISSVVTQAQKIKDTCSKDMNAAALLLF